MSQELLKYVEEKIRENYIIKELLLTYDIKELLDYNEFNITEKIQNLPFYTEQFRLLSITEESKLRKIENRLDIMKGEKYHYYKTQYDVSLKKTEIEKYYLPKDKDVILLSEEWENQKVRVDFFNSLHSAFKDTSFKMKEYLISIKGGVL